MKNTMIVDRAVRRYGRGKEGRRDGGRRGWEVGGREGGEGERE